MLIEIPRDKFEPILMKYADVIHALGKGISQNVNRSIPGMEKEVSRHFLAPYISWLDLVIIVGLSLVFALGFNAANQKGVPLFPKTTLDEAISFVSPLTAFEKHNNGQSLFVDAMPTNFYEQEHIPGAENLPLNLFDFVYELTLANVDKEKEIIVYGRSISRRYDEDLANKLSLRSHKKVRILKGGLNAWKKTGCPVEPLWRKCGMIYLKSRCRVKELSISKKSIETGKVTCKKRDGRIIVTGHQATLFPEHLLKSDKTINILA